VYGLVWFGLVLFGACSEDCILLFNFFFICCITNLIFELKGKSVLKNPKERCSCLSLLLFIFSYLKSPFTLQEDYCVAGQIKVNTCLDTPEILPNPRETKIVVDICCRMPE
jgi:hypothetical protein